MREYLCFVLLSVLVSTALCGLGLEDSSDPQPRRVRVQGRDFVLSENGEPIVMVGPNVVVKGPPYLPEVSGDSYCNDVVNEECRQTGTCTSCTTFNEADVNHIKQMGWNTIRLGVVWAGAQPVEGDQLDADFLKRLHAILDLCDRTGIHVILDNHGDMVGSAGCGNGAPMWIQKKAAPELIGKPLKTGFPYSLVPMLRISALEGYEQCGNDESKWAKYAGDPNYNILNECCIAMNSPNPGALGFTTIAQKTMAYILQEGPGRDYFVKYWTLLTQEIKRHPSAFALELMNEPMSLDRRNSYKAWRAVAEAAISIIPDLSVSVSDIGQAAIVPSWVSKIIGAGVLIDHETMQWMIKSNNLYFAWHHYADPKDPKVAAKNALAVSKQWNMPTFLTEFASCDSWRAAEEVGISHTYWHYSSYCTTGSYFGNRKVPEETFGACILGWDGGDSSKKCDPQPSAML